MKKFSSVCLVILLLSIFGSTQASFAKAAPKSFQDPSETNYAELSQAAQPSNITSQGMFDNRFETLTKEWGVSKTPRRARMHSPSEISTI